MEADFVAGYFARTADCIPPDAEIPSSRSCPPHRSHLSCASGRRQPLGVKPPIWHNDANKKWSRRDASGDISHDGEPICSNPTDGPLPLLRIGEWKICLHTERHGGD
jgi:hypothetical protein